MLTKARYTWKCDSELYDYNKKIANAENLILNYPYSKKNKEFIFEFANVLYAEGISNGHVLKYLSKG